MKNSDMGFFNYKPIPTDNNKHGQSEGINPDGQVI
jgi:hypothetical protein